MKTFIVFLGLLGAALSLPERDLDRNIFDDAWNGIQDTANSIQDAVSGAVSGAKFAALLVDCNSPLRHTAMDFKGDFIDDLKQMKDKEEVFPHFGDAINHFGDQLGQMAKNLDDLSTCMKGSWFGRTYEQTSSLKEAATSPPAANRLDIMAMITKAIDIGKFGVSVVGKIINCSGEITAVVTDSKIDEILHDLQPLLALDVFEFDQQDIDGMATDFKNASGHLKQLSSKLKNLGTCVNK